MRIVAVLGSDGLLIRSSQVRALRGAILSAKALQAKLNAIRGKDDQSADEFFATVEQNLREAKIRLVFFLEESPNELRSLVDFMNKQFERH